MGYIMKKNKTRNHLQWTDGDFGVCKVLQGLGTLARCQLYPPWAHSPVRDIDFYPATNDMRQTHRCCRNIWSKCLRVMGRVLNSTKIIWKRYLGMGSSFANALKCGKDLNRRNESKGPGWQDTVTQSPEAWTCKMIREQS